MKKAIAFIAGALILCSCNAASDYIPDEDLPVIESTSSYPAYSFNQLINEKADFIFHARVLEVEESFTDVYGIPHTPVRISVISTIKGEPAEEFTYIRSGGRGEDFIQRSSSIEVTEGMEAIFFVSRHGGIFGPSGVWLVAGDNVALNGNVINSYRTLDDAYELIENYDYGINFTNADLSGYDIGRLVYEGLNEDEYGLIKTCSLGDFIALIESLIQN
jgi:hypothetical protein